MLLYGNSISRFALCSQKERKTKWKKLQINPKYRRKTKQKWILDEIILQLI